MMIVKDDATDPTVFEPFRLYLDGKSLIKPYTILDTHTTVTTARQREVLAWVATGVRPIAYYGFTLYYSSESRQLVYSHPTRTLARSVADAQTGTDGLSSKLISHSIYSRESGFEKRRGVRLIVLQPLFSVGGR